MKKKLLDSFNSVSRNAQIKIACCSTVISTAVVSATPVFAADGLDATVEAALSTGFTNVAAMVTAIVVLAIPTTLGIISLVGGAKTGIKWIKGAIAKAS